MRLFKFAQQGDVVSSVRGTPSPTAMQGAVTRLGPAAPHRPLSDFAVEKRDALARVPAHDAARLRRQHLGRGMGASTSVIIAASVIMADVGGASDEQRERFALLWREQHGFLLDYARRRVDSDEEAQEAVAEAFGNAWLHRRSVPSGPAARLWLARATFHAVSNMQRRHARDVRLLRRMSSERRPVESPWPDTLTDAQLRLARALDSLSMQDKELLRLANWEGFDHAQIAVVMGMSPGNVAVRMHRARSRLRKFLKENEHSPGPVRHQPERGADA